jgi:uncharacterized protein (TIGR04141 family)
MARRRSGSITIDLPTWTLGVGEGNCTGAVADEFEWVLLDRKLVRTLVHARGIELADLMDDKNQLLHVKEATKSAPLSHLFAQSFVSLESLLNEPAARTHLAKLVGEARPAHQLRLRGLQRAGVTRRGYDAVVERFQTRPALICWRG